MLAARQDYGVVRWLMTALLLLRVFTLDAAGGAGHVGRSSRRPGRRRRGR
jgi:hypothetical protein